MKVERERQLAATGKVSRINVGHFMSSLINNDALWIKWKGQMPVIHSK